jgi:hypothetical protein
MVPSGCIGRTSGRQSGAALSLLLTRPGRGVVACTSLGRCGPANTDADCSSGAHPAQPCSVSTGSSRAVYGWASGNPNSVDGPFLAGRRTWSTGK